MSAIEVVDAIFGAGKTRFKTVLGGRLPLKLSSVPFCQGLPGSIRATSMFDSTIHSRIALLMNSGPLSERKIAGAPCWLTSRASTSITRFERMLPATSIAKLSRVNSSTTVKHLSC